MIYRTNCKNGDKISQLGFGCMRLPQAGGGEVADFKAISHSFKIDEEKTAFLIRKAVDMGVNYFDTAYRYHMGGSQIALGKALSGIRGRVFIADKIPPYFATTVEAAQKIFDISLKNLQTDYIDYYLVHMLTDMPTLEKLTSVGIMAWLEGLKRDKKIRNIGFSFHGGGADFKKLIAAYDWDFCQVQYNFVDENTQAGSEGVRLAASLGIPIMIMEPLRGGSLVRNLPKEVSEIYKSVSQTRTYADWALRWLYDKPELLTVLSGMNEEGQLAENVATASEASIGSLTEREREVFVKIRELISAKTPVPCTACGYCMPCPAGVNIPACFAAYNNKALLNERLAWYKYALELGMTSKRTAYAHNCKECGKCEKHCPQGIAIIKELKTVRKSLEKWWFKAFIFFTRIATKAKKTSAE